MFTASSIAWVVSVFLPEPWRYVLWAVTLVFEFGFIYLPGTRRAYARMPLSRSHFPERVGLFTIIVLGESVAGVVAGLADQNLRSTATITAALGLLVSFGLWWVYFANLEGGVLKGLGRWSVVFWVYSHLPLMMALTALGVGIDHAVAEDPSHALGSFGVWLVAIAVNGLATAKVTRGPATRRKVAWRLGGAAAAVAIGIVVASTDGAGLVLLAPLAAVSLIPLPSDLLGWESRAADIDTAPA
jgi:low temperature requirement protein LtrA